MGLTVRSVALPPLFHCPAKITVVFPPGKRGKRYLIHKNQEENFVSFIHHAFIHSTDIACFEYLFCASSKTGNTVVNKVPAPRELIFQWGRHEGKRKIIMV